MDKGDGSPVKSKEPGVKMAPSPDKMKDTEVKAEEQTPGGSKRKRRSATGATGVTASTPDEVEPRTPAKRQRVPVQKFQSPADELIPMPSTSKQKDQTELLHKKSSFLGVRGEEGSFYLCKTIQNVFSNTRKFRIQWLDLDQPPNVYKLDFVDTTDADCILTNVRMERVARDTYRLPVKEKNRVEEILNKALKKERGEPIEETVIADDYEDDEDMDQESDEDETPKKSKSRKSLPPPKDKKAKAKVDKGKKVTPSKKDKTEKKKGPDRALKPNPKIKILEKDPFFETREKVEFVSKSNRGKLAIRAVMLNDKKLLQSLIDDTETVYKLDEMRSVDVLKNALHYALEKGDHEAIKMLVKDFCAENKRVKNGSPQSVLITASDTGSYNPMSLGGLRAVNQISQSRGSKQGNDAFVKDLNKNSYDWDDYVEDALKLGVSKETLDVLINALPDQPNEHLMQRAVSNVYQAVLCGNRKLAGYLVEEALKDTYTGFGYLHKDVLLNDKEDLRQTILAASVKKKPWDNQSITPLHCAAINPNVAYLTRLLTVQPDINLEDRAHRRPLHFAAVCEGIGPLEYLLQRGASPMEVDNQGMTPLHYACSAGRPRNVDILLKKAKDSSSKQGDVFQHKWGPGGVDRPSRSSYCPIHIAVSYNHVAVVKILIKHQVDVNKLLSAGKNRVNPLMTAAGHGDLELCKVLIQNGAHVEQLDKLKRSALIHAVMNGNTHVASYLLHLGADPNRADSSGNTVVHYAAAYGWLFCLKLLHEAGADLGVANEWKTTPVGIAFLKGHIGIVDFLLKQKDVDINFKNDAGLTLTSVAASSTLTEGLLDQFRYLIDKKADPTIKDINGMDSLHHIASSKVVQPKGWCWDTGVDLKGEVDEKKMDITVKIAKILIDGGCDPTAETEDGKTALMLAIEQLNIKLVKFLVDVGGTVTSHKSDAGETILHLMAHLCMESDLSPILKILVEQKPSAQEGKGVKEASKLVVENGDSGDSEQKSEAMEVDTETPVKTDQDKKDGSKPTVNGEGDGKEEKAVNGMEVDEGKQPQLAKMNSIASQEDIWPIMATELDHQGYTPLLLACKVYRDFKKLGNMSDDDVKQNSLHGRNFIAALVDLTGADVNATVKEKVFPETVPDNEEERYTKDGKFSVLHILLHVGHEVVEGLKNAGLQLICKYKPNTEHRNLNNQTALALAVEAKSVDALAILIKAGADPNTLYGTEAGGFFTPLHKAAEYGSVDMVKMLIEAGADVNKPNSKTEEFPLDLAVHYRGEESNVIEIARKLLDAGAQLNEGKHTVLHTAVLSNFGTSNASTDLEEFLISRGADVFNKDEKQRLPLHYAFISKNDPKSKSQLDPIELCSILTDAMQNKMLDAQDENGLSALHLAAMRGATICCVHLLQRGVPILGTDKNGHTALSLAVKYKHDSCAIMLLQKGAKVDSNIVVPPEENQDRTEYYTTNSGKKMPIWKWKRSRYAEQLSKPEVFDTYEVAIQGELQGVAHMVLDSIGLTGRAVEAALRVNKYHIALRHLHHMKDNAIVRDYKNKDNQNLLHILALETVPEFDQALQLKVAKVLVEKGVSLTAKDKYKRYPLVYVALKHQQIELAKFFLESSPGLDLNQKDIYERTLIAAFFWDQEDVGSEDKERMDYLKLFLDAGASLDIRYHVQWPETPLFDVAIAELPLDFFEPLEYTGRLTPLISALSNVDMPMIRFLLKNGASPNLSDQNGVSPLMHAVKQNDVSLVKLLLNNDYKVSKSTQESKPALKKKLSRPAFEVKPVSNDVCNDDDDDNDEESGADEGSDGDDDQEPEDYPEDSDHDTDVVDDDTDNDLDSDHLPIPRLGSKTLSMKRQSTIQPVKDDFETVEKTSAVDLSATDNAGWTVIHHLVSPLEYGTFDSEEILYVLAKAGAPLTTETKEGLSPLKMALKVGAANIARRLQSLLNIEADKQEKVSKQVFHEKSDGDAQVSASLVKVDSDAEAMVQKLLPDPSVEEASKKTKHNVDKKCMAADTGEIVIEKDSGRPYDIILSKIEVRSLLYDTYNFYKMQIIYHRVKDIYILFTKWGRIGDTGMYQQTPYHTLEEVVVAFCKIFKSKTGNSWSNISSFVNQPKKYRLVEIDNQPSTVLRVDFKLESSIPSQLSENLSDLLKEMADVGMMQAAMENAKIAEEYMPFGRIKREALIEARKILQKIGDIVAKMEKNKRTASFDQSDYQDCCEKISVLTTEYYSLIPQTGYAFDRIQPFVLRSQVKVELRLISNLLDLETASKILLGAQYRINEQNPLDYIYKALGCRMTPLREDDVESQYILKYIRSSSDSPPKVVGIFKLWRPGEDEREKFQKLDNHKLLWHGSNMSNFMSILRNGLLVAPPEAPITGHAFGEGIYAADTFAKSMMYCGNYSPKSDMKCALLCEVALGNCKEDVDNSVDVDLVNSEFNSLKIHGSNVPDEGWDLTLPFGATMPMGFTETKQKWMSPIGEVNRRVPYTEYIIEDSDQISLRYLVQFV